MRWMCGPLATGMLLPLACIAQVPVGFALVRTDVVVAQALTEQDFKQLVQQAKQFRHEGNYSEAAEMQ